MRRRIEQGKYNLRSLIDSWASARADRPPRFNETLFILLIGLGISVFPTAIGVQSLPGSLERGPTVLGQGSTALIVLGCWTSALGLIWWRSIDRALAIESAGKLILGVGMLFYSFALYQTQTAANRAIVFGFTFFLSLGCFVRAVRILLYVRGRFLRAEAERCKESG